MPPAAADRLRTCACICVALAVGWITLAGASAPGKLMRSGDYAAAVAAWKQQESSRPNDARVKRGLGVALLKTGDAAAATGLNNTTVGNVGT